MAKKLDKEKHKNAYYPTPKIWVDYAHKRVSKVLGEDWKDEYIVWDNCSGTCELTRDYTFRELYTSTLVEEELNEGLKYNKEAVHFQFDFLNDEIPTPGELFNGGCKVPDGLINAFKQNKKIVFLINPPYATAGTLSKDNKHKAGTAINLTNKNMIADGYGKSAQNLYSQFLYRIQKLKQYYGLTNCYIAIFCPTLFMTGGSFDNFRKYFLDDFKFIDGFQFQASHFADVADNWGIGFTIWKSEESTERQNFLLDICDVNKNSQTGDIEIQSTKTLYNLDGKQNLREWAIEPVKKLKTYDTLNVTSGIKIKNTGNAIGKIFKDALGYLYFNSNNVEKSVQNVALFTTAFGDGHGFGINNDNFYRVCSAFTVRKLIENTWINSKDEFLAPNESHPKFEEFVNDSVVFSLFEPKSNQSSLRSINYKDSTHDIKNEFFWMSRQEILQLAEENDNLDVYNDAITDKDRYVYKYLQHVTLSKEAKELLDFASELVRKSFKYREIFNENNPQYQINNWDCGYYQLKALRKEYMPEEFAEFRALVKKLADKMRPMIYELGFLRK